MHCLCLPCLQSKEKEAVIAKLKADKAIAEGRILSLEKQAKRWEKIAEDTTNFSGEDDHSYSQVSSNLEDMPESEEFVIGVNRKRHSSGSLSEAGSAEFSVVAATEYPRADHRGRLPFKALRLEDLESQLN